MHVIYLSHNNFFFFLTLYFQNSLEKIINSSEHDFHEFIDDIPQTFATKNLEPKFQEETNGEKTQTLFNDFSTSSVDASKGYTFYTKYSSLTFLFCGL